MSWKSCINEHIIKISKDEERARALLNMAKERCRFWSEIKVKPKYAFIVIEGYYEIIKELLTALFYIEGYKSDNHECLIAYLKKYYPDISYEVSVIYQLKNIRNSIDYRGVFVDVDYLNRNKLEFEHIIKLLQKIISSKLS